MQVKETGKIQIYGGDFEFLILAFSLDEIRSGVCSGEGRGERENGENEEKCYKETEKNENGVKCGKKRERKQKRMGRKSELLQG